MDSRFTFAHHLPLLRFLALIVPVVLSGCDSHDGDVSLPRETSPETIELHLVPHAGDSPIDREIQEAQSAVTTGRLPKRSLERLGWAYVSKARESFDPGYYRIAQSCADAIDRKTADAPESLLLRGHVLNSLHHFQEAEVVARRLVEKRGIPFDHLLLGDALMEQGKLEEAISCYQTGVDLRPCLQSYARAGWARWLLGDLDGAIEATGRAVAAGSPRDPASLAWALTRLGSFHFLDGNLEAAAGSTDAALQAIPGFPPALLLQGRLLLARAETPEALSQLKRAAKLNPLPEYQWMLAEALRGAGEADEADRIEALLLATGERLDRRTFAVFLATRQIDPQRAVALAREELDERRDVFTLDALAWALCSAGRIEEARTCMEEALAIFPEDGRLFLHAAVIARQAGELGEAREWSAAAEEYRHTLLHSERLHLDTLGETLASEKPPEFPVGDGRTQDNQTSKL